MNRGHRVQVPAARGVFMPEIASITDDFPVLCSPDDEMLLETYEPAGM